MDRRGYDPRSFPSVGLISDLRREESHFKVQAQVYRLTPETYLTPTGQMIMYPLIFQNRSIDQIKLYQVKPVYRIQSDTNRRLLRHKEIHWFYQLHACFPTQAQMKTQFDQLKRMFSRFLDSEGIAHLVHQRVGSQVFPGARRTIGFDTILRGGKALQIGTLHDLGDNFSRALQGKPLYQLCLGFTQRLLGALRDHYGPDLRDLHNPYPLLRIARDRGSTLKQTCTNLEQYYQNQYSYTGNEDRYLHIRTGQVMGKAEMVRHKIRVAAQVKARVMAQVRTWCSLSSDPAPHCLGLDPGGIRRYVQQKV